MKNTKPTLAIIILIIATMFFLQPQAVEASPTTVIGINDDLQLSMSIPSTTIFIGTTVPHTMTVQNIGLQIRKIRFWNDYPHTYWFDLQLSTLDDEEVALYSDDKMVHPTVMYLELFPGETYPIILDWDYYIFDSHTGEYTPPDPGYYHLRGLFRGEWDCEDPYDPAEYVHIWTQAMTIHLVSGAVGGVWVPVDKLGLLAPYIGLASTVVVASVAAAIYAKRAKHRKEK